MVTTDRIDDYMLDKAIKSMDLPDATEYLASKIINNIANRKKQNFLQNVNSVFRERLFANIPYAVFGCFLLGIVFGAGMNFGKQQNNNVTMAQYYYQNYWGY